MCYISYSITMERLQLFTKLKRRPKLWLSKSPIPSITMRMLHTKLICSYSRKLSCVYAEMENDIKIFDAWAECRQLLVYADLQRKLARKWFWLRNVPESLCVSISKIFVRFEMTSVFLLTFTENIFTVVLLIDYAVMYLLSLAKRLIKSFFLRGPDCVIEISTPAAWGMRRKQAKSYSFLIEFLSDGL